MTGNQCRVCGGTGWMEFPHPDGEGGLTATAVGPCEGCIQDENCPACGRSMMDWGGGALFICVHCGFTFDEADEPTVSQTVERREGRKENMTMNGWPEEPGSDLTEEEIAARREADDAADWWEMQQRAEAESRLTPDATADWSPEQGRRPDALQDAVAGTLYDELPF